MSNTLETKKVKEALDGLDSEGRTLEVNESHPQRNRPDRNFRKY